MELKKSLVKRLGKLNVSRTKPSPSASGGITTPLESPGSSFPGSPSDYFGSDSVYTDYAADGSSAHTRTSSGQLYSHSHSRSNSNDLSADPMMASAPITPVTPVTPITPSDLYGFSAATLSNVPSTTPSTPFSTSSEPQTRDGDGFVETGFEADTHGHPQAKVEPVDRDHQVLEAQVARAEEKADLMAQQILQKLAHDDTDRWAI